MGDALSFLYPWTLALHLMAVISWMAGMFYLPRLFVHHVERSVDTPEIAPVFVDMERKLLRVIMNPAMVATWAFGLMLAFTPGLVDWSEIWPWIKAILVLTMTWHHHLLARWRKDLEAGSNVRSGRFYRIANEVPTVLMAGIVVMVIVRPF